MPPSPPHLQAAGGRHGLAPELRPGRPAAAPGPVPVRPSDRLNTPLRRASGGGSGVRHPRVGPPCGPHAARWAIPGDPGGVGPHPRQPVAQDARDPSRPRRAARKQAHAGAAVGAVHGAGGAGRPIQRGLLERHRGLALAKAVGLGRGPAIRCSRQFVKAGRSPLDARGPRTAFFPPPDRPRLGARRRASSQLSLVGALGDQHRASGCWPGEDRFNLSASPSPNDRPLFRGIFPSRERPSLELQPRPRPRGWPRPPSLPLREGGVHGGAK